MSTKITTPARKIWALRRKAKARSAAIRLVAHEADVVVVVASEAAVERAAESVRATVVTSNRENATTAARKAIFLVNVQRSRLESPLRRRLVVLASHAARKDISRVTAQMNRSSGHKRSNQVAASLVAKLITMHAIARKRNKASANRRNMVAAVAASPVARTITTLVTAPAVITASRRPTRFATTAKKKATFHVTALRPAAGANATKRSLAAHALIVAKKAISRAIPQLSSRAAMAEAKSRMPPTRRLVEHASLAAKRVISLVSAPMLNLVAEVVVVAVTNEPASDAEARVILSPTSPVRMNNLM